jgi:hypothetical protein
MAPIAPSTLIGSDFFAFGKCFLNCTRRLHVHAVHACFARKFEQTRSAGIFGVHAMTKSRHAFTCFAHRSKCTGRCLL